MELITEEIKMLLPPLYSQEEKSFTEVKVPLKIFDPSGRYTFYATEWDGEDTLFGFCCSALGTDCDELGYASLSEMASVRNRYHLGLERDISWDTNTTLKQVIDGEVR